MQYVGEIYTHWIFFVLINTDFSEESCFIMLFIPEMFFFTQCGLVYFIIIQMIQMKPSLTSISAFYLSNVPCIDLLTNNQTYLSGFISSYCFHTAAFFYIPVRGRKAELPFPLK